MVFFSKPARISVIPVVFVIAFFSSCNSLPGDGGTSTISGKVFLHEFNASGIDFSDYYVGEQRVYIIYGDGTAYDDETKTSYDGTYQFPFLRKGSYQVFTYSDCIDCISSGLTKVVLKDVEITDNHQDVTVEDLVIEKH